MKKFALLIGSLLVLSIAHADAVKTVEAFHQALANGDKKAALGLLATEAMIYESGHKEASRDAYAEHHLASDMAFSQQVRRKVLHSQTLGSGNEKLVFQETEVEGTYKGKPVHLIGLETVFLTYADGTWKIRHIHWSSRKAH